MIFISFWGVDPLVVNFENQKIGDQKRGSKKTTFRADDICLTQLLVWLIPSVEKAVQNDTAFRALGGADAVTTT